MYGFNCTDGENKCIIVYIYYVNKRRFIRKDIYGNT